MKDWETILLARAGELACDELLVLANFCENEKDRYLGATDAVVSTFDWFTHHGRQLMHDAVITECEYRAGTFQQYYKTVVKFIVLFKDENSSVRRAGLILNHVSTRVTKYPYAAQFREHGDAVAFAKAYISTLRSWSEGTSLAALDVQREPAERQAIIERFYQTMEQDVVAAPDGHAMEYVYFFLTMTKQ